MPELYQQ